MGEVVALIPARGGSKGIAKKNLRCVGGVPLLVRSVWHARDCSKISSVYVSTDDPNIAALAKKHGALVIDRPAELANDLASTESVIHHTLEVLRGRGSEVDLVVLLQCTSPFRQPGQLDDAIEQFYRKGCDSMVSVVREHAFFWKSNPSGEGYAPINYDPVARPRRQDVAQFYRETGSFYLFRSAIFEEHGVRLAGRIEAFEVPPHDALEIDEWSDLQQARQQSAQMGEPLRLAGLEALQWLVLDVDGTLTDGTLHLGEDGVEHKRFSLRDGLGIRLWKEAGGKVAIITGENSHAVALRAKKLNVDHLVLGCRDKSAAMLSLQRTTQLANKAFLCMGDDINDLPMADYCALFVAPSDAQTDVLHRADWRTQAKGGQGAVRELIDHLLSRKVQLGGLRPSIPPGGPGNTEAPISTSEINKVA